MSAIQTKKLLILGASANEVSLIRRAQQYGVYVIVADYNTDHSISVGKDVADEYWDISWSDIPALEAKCREAKIDGVLSGYSEIRVENNIKLCERLGLPCYINMKQLEITRDKVKFKQACRENGVPVIKEYATVDEVDAFPVIVKPTDRAGSIGVGIATNREELEVAYDYAMEMSLCKKVIIEQFIYKATKFDVYYSIINGEITQISSNDVVYAKNNGFEKVVQIGWVLPSVHNQQFLEKADPLLQRFIRNIGIENGYIFFSGFADNDSNFVFFECGYRLCGGHLYEYFPHIGHVNHMDLLLFYALTGDAACVKNDVVAAKDLKCVTINVYAKAGLIAKIDGFDKIRVIPECYFALQQGRIGMECEDDKAIMTKIGMVYFCSESPDVLADCVQKLYDIIHVEDAEGNDLIYDKVDPEMIRNWWQ